MDMIHDFATLPRVSRHQPAVVAEPHPRGNRRGRWVLLLVGIIAWLIWNSMSPSAPPEPEFVPGPVEAIEYQAALAIEAVDTQGAAPRRKQVAAPVLENTAAEPQPETLEVAAEILAFQQKLKAARLEDHEPEYGFYDSLARSSWRVPVQRGIYITEEDRKRANYRYMLQAASVRDVAHAQQLVKKLRQLGMEASYQSADPSNPTGWYRINVGPFNNVSKMNKAEDILVSMRMMPLKRRIP